MRLIADLELTASGTLLDRIHRAEKRGWVDDSLSWYEFVNLET